VPNFLTASCLALGLCVSALNSTAALAADRIKVVTGHGVWDSYVTEAAVRAGLFKPDEKPEILYSSGSGETLQAVISGAADVGEVGTLGALAAFLKGAPVRIIGGESTGSAEFWYARTDSPIKTLKDAAGKSIAFSSVGSSTNSVVRAFVQDNKIEAKLVPTGSPQVTLTAVMTNQIDVGWSSPPFGLKEIDEGKIRIIATGNDVAEIRNQTIRVLIVNVESLKTKREALQRFMDARAKAVDVMYEENSPALGWFAESNNIPLDMARRMRTFYPKAMLDPGALSGIQQMMDEAVLLKFMPRHLTGQELSEVMQPMPPRR
jgi:NitT/TauT family transport system substrate-binding protein